jgi:pimeloyl-ACP methyl ester carboxylesterase
MAKLATQSWGGGEDGERPLAVLVHGITSSSGSWRRVGPALAERGWGVVAVDLRGHGDSPAGQEGALHGTGGVGITELAADVAETISRRPVELVVGHSLGALTVMTLLGAEPGFAKHAVIEDPPCREAVNPAQMIADIERDVARVRDDPEGYLAELQQPPYGMEREDAEVKLSAMQRLDAATAIAELGGEFQFDVVALARAIQVPTLLFLAREANGSALTGQARHDVATALASGWTEVVDCGHNVHREAFDSFMRRLDAWLDRVGAAAVA